MFRIQWYACILDSFQYMCFEYYFKKIHIVMIQKVIQCPHDTQITAHSTVYNRGVAEGGANIMIPVTNNINYKTFSVFIFHMIRWRMHPQDPFRQYTHCLPVTDSLGRHPGVWHC